MTVLSLLIPIALARDPVCDFVKAAAPDAEAGFPTLRGLPSPTAPGRFAVLRSPDTAWSCVIQDDQGTPTLSCGMPGARAEAEAIAATLRTCLTDPWQSVPTNTDLVGAWHLPGATETMLVVSTSARPPTAGFAIAPARTEPPPVGPIGDRDGDGVPDDQDLCPGAMEVMNGFDDTDGCPDEKVDLAPSFVESAKKHKNKAR